MNATCYQFNARCAAHLPRPGRVVELGSRNVNGSVRGLWPGAEYIGIDTRPGPEVDVIADAASWEPAQSADLVVCNNLLEHVPEPWRVLDNALRILKPEGYLILVAPGPGWPAHGIDGGALAPGEHYRNVSELEIDTWLGEAGFTHRAIEMDGGLVLALASWESTLPSLEVPVIVASNGYTTCTDCNRLLRLEDGPTCPECLARRGPAPVATSDPGPLPEETTAEAEVTDITGRKPHAPRRKSE